MVTNVSSSISSALGLGYGIDSSSIVTQLVAAVRQPKDQALTTRQNKVAAQISAIANASGALDTFSTALTKLLKSSDYSGTPVITDTSIATVSLTQKGDLSSLPVDMVVKQLATSQVLNSTSLANSGAAVGQGTLTLTTASGSYAITIDSSNNTLSGLATAINNASAGVTASVITDSSGSRLSIKGAVGAANAFTLTDSGNADTDLQRFTWNGSAGGMTRSRAAQDAIVALDGQDSTFSSNTIVDAIPNVTINLVKADPSTSVTIAEDQPTTTMKDLIDEFVTAYNDLWNSLADLTKAGTNGTDGGILASDSNVRDMKNLLNRLSSTSMVASGPYTTLAQIGVKTNKDGTLTVDDAQFDAALKANPAAVTNMINPATQDSANPGLAGALDAIKTKMQDSGTGELVQAKARYTAVQDKLADERSKFEDYMSSYQDNLNATFSAMDNRLAALKATQSYLEQQIQAWNNSNSKN